jgi:hypothetical protein
MSPIPDTLDFSAILSNIAEKVLGLVNHYEILSNPDWLCIPLCVPAHLAFQKAVWLVSLEATSQKQQTASLSNLNQTEMDDIFCHNESYLPQSQATLVAQSKYWSLVDIITFSKNGWFCLHWSQVIFFKSWLCHSSSYSKRCPKCVLFDIMDTIAAPTWWNLTRH